MDHALLQTWLGLPPGFWPPDHYVLLSFPSGSADADAVETRVMERMDRLRPHQLLQPDLVTEGMNRLAQALITLTDPAERAAYDAELGIASAALPAPTRPPPAITSKTAAAPDRGAVVVADPVFDDDIFADEIGPADRTDPSDLTQIIQLSLPEVETVPYEIIEDTPPAPEILARPTPGIVEAVAIVPAPAVLTSTAPTGRRWLYARLALLRKALRAWDRLGFVLGDPQDPIDRPGRVLILMEAARECRPFLPLLRGIVGGPGEPGGVVAAVISQPLLLDTVRQLLPDQRQTLAIDWRRGRSELQGESDRLRAISREGRNRPAGMRSSRVLARGIKESPELALAVLAGFALTIAFLRSVGGR